MAAAKATALSMAVAVAVADAVHALHAADAQCAEDVVVFEAMVAADQYMFLYERMVWNANLHTIRVMDFHSLQV